jgi:glutamyl/glutaminyl-tRNA synthetase
VDALCAELSLGKAKVMQPWRVALTGDKVSPGFFDLLSVLGRDVVLKRVEPFLAQ